MNKEINKEIILPATFYMNVTEQLCVTVFWVLLRRANSKFCWWRYLLSKKLLKKLLFESVFKKGDDTSDLFVSVAWVPL